MARGTQEDTVRDMENLPFSTDTPCRFSEGSHTAIRGRPCGNAQIVSSAMRGSSALQCVRTLRGSIQYGRNPRMNVQAYALALRWVLAAEAVSLQSHYR